MGRAKREMEEEEAKQARGYDTGGVAGKSVCVSHFRNRWLKSWMKKHTYAGICSYCGESGKVVDMVELMEYVCGRIVRYMGPMENEALFCTSSFVDKDDPTLPPGTRDENGLLVPDDVKKYESAGELTDVFGLITDNDTLNEDIENCFLIDNWIRRDPFGLRLGDALSYSWEDFSRKIKSVFPDPSAVSVETIENALTTKPFQQFEYDLMTPIVLSEAIAGCLKLAKRCKTRTEVFRCRPDDKGIVYTEFKDLTAAPSPYAKANRLSLAGDSVFYGSFDAKTPVDEVLNYCHGKTKPTISLGKFVTTKGLTLIDLTDIPKPDFWMPDDNWEVFRFLIAFHEEITKPIDQQNQLLEYIPTQAFSLELRKLAKAHNIDGLIYRSSKTSKNNVCLFYNNVSSASVLSLVESFKY